MDRNEFIEELNKEGYDFDIEGDSIVITHNWSISMDVKGITKGVVFANEMGLSMFYVEEIPEGTVFKNGGGVYLWSLTKLPKDTVFENKGAVVIPHVTGVYQYQGRERLFETIDGITMLIEHQRIVNGYTIKTARYFGGGPIEELGKCYVAEKDGETSHGGSIKYAIEDLEFKLIERTNIEEVVGVIKSTGRVTLDQFRRITGACREGTRHHLAGLDIVLDDITDMALDKALEAMEGTSFGGDFKKALTQD